MPEVKDTLLFSSSMRDIVKDLADTYLQDKDLLGFCESIYQVYSSHDEPLPKEGLDRFRYFLENGLSLSHLPENPSSFADFTEAVQSIDWDDPVIQAKIDTWMNSAVDVAQADHDIDNDLLFSSISDIPDEMQRHGIPYEQDFLFFNRRNGKSVIVNGEETGAWDMLDHLGYPDTVRIQYEDGKPYLQATAVCIGDEEETSYYLIPSDRLREASEELPETQEAIQAYEKEHPEVKVQQEAVADVDFSGIHQDALQKYIQNPFEENGSGLDLGSFQFHSLNFVATVGYEGITPVIYIDPYRPADGAYEVTFAEKPGHYGKYLEGDTEHQFPYFLTSQYNRAFVGIDVADNKKDIYRELAYRAKDIARDIEDYKHLPFSKMPDPLKGTYSSAFSQELYENIQAELQYAGETTPNQYFFVEGDTLYTVKARWDHVSDSDCYYIDVHPHGATALKEHQPIPLGIRTRGFLEVPSGASYSTFLFMAQGRMEPEYLDQVYLRFTSDRSEKGSSDLLTCISLKSAMQPYSDDNLSPEAFADLKQNLRENMESREMDWSDDETECSAKFSCFSINPVSCSEGVFFRIAFQTEDAKDQESLISTNDREPCVLDSDIVATKEEFLAMDFDTFKQKMRETASSYFDSCKFPVASENSIREVVFPPYVKEQEKKETMTIQQAAEQFAASAATYQSALMDSGMTRTEANKGMMAILREVNEKSKAQGIEH